ncbi:MAG: WXG100 family type VII secretion target [Actinomycetota bacterium]|nr:WXG100 family type VII secretion target [Actinomycetota bacterium]
MAQTTAETSAMTLASTHVDNAGQAIATLRNQVQAAVDATTSGYVSPAATVFRGVMAQWGQDFTTIINGLETIRTSLVGTTKNYQGAMNLEGESANQIASLLNGGG